MDMLQSTICSIEYSLILFTHISYIPSLFLSDRLATGIAVADIDFDLIESVRLKLPIAQVSRAKYIYIEQCSEIFLCSSLSVLHFNLKMCCTFVPMILFYFSKILFSLISESFSLAIIQLKVHFMVWRSQKVLSNIFSKNIHRACLYENSKHTIGKKQLISVGREMGQIYRNFKFYFLIFIFP